MQLCTLATYCSRRGKHTHIKGSSSSNAVLQHERAVGPKRYVAVLEAHMPCGRLHGIESRFDDDDSARKPPKPPKLTPIPSDAGEHPPVLHDEGDILYVGHRVPCTVVRVPR